MLTPHTEVLWSTTSRQLHWIPELPLRVSTGEVVRDLGVFFDADLLLKTYVMKID